MVQHTTHDWPTTDQLNEPKTTRNLARADELDEINKLDLSTHEGAMAGLVSGEVRMSRKTRKVMGLD